MVIMSEEGWKEWKKFQDYGWEINLCMQEQGFMYEEMTDEESGITLELFGNLMEEFTVK